MGGPAASRAAFLFAGQRPVQRASIACTGGAAGTKTLTIAVYDEAFAQADLGAGAAASVVLFVILGAFMVLYFRFAPEGD